jgi:hemerythrin
MTLLTWNDQLLLGIANLDEQHRCLVDRINELHTELSLSGPNRRKVGEILESLVDYAMNHFVVEEEIFQRHEDALSAADLAEHNGFTSRIMALLEKSQNEGPDACMDALTALSDWLTHHIMVVDQACVTRVGALCVY